MIGLRMVLIAAFFLLVPQNGIAHRPTTFDGDKPVTDPMISWTIPGTFSTGTEIFEFDLTYDKAFAAPFEIMSPTAGGNGSFRPRYAVIGPGFPLPSAKTLAALPDGIEVPDGEGVFLELNAEADRYIFFEGVMRRVLVSSGTIALRLAAGTHKVVIWANDGATGEFMFGFGVEENFEDGGFSGVFENWSEFAY